MSSILQRERLYQLMDQGLERPIVWVQGEAGVGKSTFVSGYLSDRKLPCLWYQVDQGDDDIATLFSYMGMAAENRLQCRVAAIPLFTVEHQGNVPVFSRRYFEKLFSCLDRPCVIVFDDYHEVPVGSLFHEVIRNGLYEIPIGINIIVVSRTAPPPPMAHLRSLGRVNLIDRKELRFTREETEEIVKLRRADEEWATESLRLYEMTQGWIAGIVLMLESNNNDVLRGFAAAGRDLKVPEQIFHYFQYELFQKIDDESLRMFFLKTAFFQEIIPDAAVSLTGNHNAGSILADLHAKTFFTEQHESFYRYHPLFREFLLNAANLMLPEDEVTLVKRKAANLMLEYGRIEEAADLFLESGDWCGIVGLVLKKAQVLIALGRNRTVMNWISKIPSGIFDKEPYLLFWRGISHIPFDPVESRNDLTKAFELFKIDNDTVGILFSWSAVADITIYRFDNAFLDYWLTLLPLIEKVLDDNQHLRFTEIDARLTVSMFNVMSFRQPDNPRIAEMEVRARDFFFMKNHPDVNLRLQTGVYLVVYYLWRGYFTKADEIITRFPELSCSPVVSDLTLITLKTTEVLFHFFTASCDTSIRMVWEALDMSEKTGVRVWDFHVTGHGIAAALSSGDMATANLFIKRIESKLNEALPYDLGYYYGLLAWRAMIEGDFDSADYNMLQAVRLLEQVEIVGGDVVGNMALYELLSMKNECSNAGERLDRVYQIGQRFNSTVIRFMGLVVETKTCLERGEEQSGLEMLREAMALGRESNIMNFYWWRSALMLPLCIKALEAEIEVDYVRKLIRKRNIIPEYPPLELENWPWPVKIFTLGRFNLLVDGLPVKSSRKPSYKQMEMLKVLVTLGGTETSEEKIRDLLWPDSEGDMARDLFKVTLHRLRKLLGNTNVITVRDGRIALDRHYVWVDAWAFEHLLGAAKGLGYRSEGDVYMGKAKVLYEGRFLESDAEASWQFPMRDRLHHKYLSTFKDKSI